MTDLRLALRPGAVSPAIAGLHQAGLPLLHLGRTRPPVALGSLDHCPPPPQLACGATDKKNRKMNYLLTRTLILSAEIWPVRSLSLVKIRKTGVRAAARVWMCEVIWITISSVNVTSGTFTTGTTADSQIKAGIQMMASMNKLRLVANKGHIKKHWGGWNHSNSA